MITTRTMQASPPSQRGAQHLRMVLMLVAGMAMCACDNLKRSARYNPEAPSEHYVDGASARPLPEGVVVHGQPRTNELLYQGRVNGNLADTFPFPIEMKDLQRGRERFEIYCSPCHGRLGNGQGEIVRRGFTPPPSFHIERLRKEPVGHFFDVITNGWGAMYSYNARVAVEDRWRIAAYIRALQLSQNVPAADLSAADREKLQGTQK